MSRPGAVAITALLLAVALAAVPRRANALDCSDIYSSLYPCLSYFQGGGDPTTDCCNGVKSVVTMARTAADRQAACTCLKSLATGVSGNNVALAKALPAKCGVSIPFKLGPSTNCAKVH